MRSGARGGGGCGGSPVGLTTFEFRRINDPATRADDDLLTLKVAGLGATFGWAPGELNLLPAEKLDNVYAKFDPTSSRHELLVFARDPAEQRAQLGKIWGGLGGPKIGCWSQVAGSKLVAYATDLERVPRTRILPKTTNYHPFNGFMFWPTAGEPLADKNYPNFVPFTIKATWLLDHGQCSVPIDVQQDVLVAVQQGLWDGFAAGAGAGARRHWLDTFTFLDHAAPWPTDTRGGFFVDLHFSIKVKVFNDPHVCANAAYEWFLDDGILAVHANLLHTMNYGVFSESKLQTPLLFALEETVPFELFKKIRSRQATVIKDPKGNPFKCQQSAINNCFVPAVGLGAAIKNGGPWLGLNTKETDDLVATANKPADLKDKIHAIDVEQATGFANWRCMPNPEPKAPDPNQTVCAYMLRAKRLTLDPQFAELVWFDGKELNNPTYALYVASYAADDTARAVAQLCVKQQQALPQQSYQRAYLGASMGSFSP